MKDEPARTRAIVSSSHEKHKFEFTKDDAMLLLEHVEDILDIETGRSQEAWEAWAKAVGLSCLSQRNRTAVLAGLISVESGAQCKTMAGLLRETSPTCLRKEGQAVYGTAGQECKAQIIIKSSNKPEPEKVAGRDIFDGFASSL